MAKKKTVEGKQPAFGMEGKQVALLHTQITTIGIEIDEAELKAQRFGATTREAVRRLQLLAGAKPTGKVDRQTQKLLDGALKRLQAAPPLKNRSLQANPSEYYIEGNVTDLDGLPLVGATIIADELNLRTTHEMGRSKTDDQGHYQIRRVVSKNERKTNVADDKKNALDLRLRVVSPKSKTLYTTETCFRVASGANIPIAMGGIAHSTPPEFANIGITLKPHLSGLHPGEFIENENFQDITFLARTSGLNKTQIAFYSLAKRLAGTTALPPELFYGLFTQNIPPNAAVIALASAGGGVDFNFNAQRLLNSVLSTSDAILAQAIHAAVLKNILPPSYESRVQKDLASLAPLRTNAALSATFGMGKTKIQVVLDAAAIPEKKQQQFVSLLSAKSGTDKDFWKALSKNPDFSKEEAATLHFSVNVGIFAKGHMPLVQKLMEMRAQGKISKSSDLARLNAADWKALLNSTFNGRPIGIPANFTAKNDQQAKEAFANLLERNFERAYPTMAFSARLAEDKSSPFMEKDKSVLVKFFNANPNFNLFTNNVDRYLKDNPEAVADSEREGLRDALNKTKRVFKLASRYAAVKPLLADGIHSSQQIYAMGESSFVGKYSGNVNIGETEASTIYDKASQTYAQALMLATNMGAIAQQLNPAAIGNIDLGMVQQEGKDLPNLETLFGSFDFCASDPNKTVLSPAAYLVDMLYFLSKRKSKPMDAQSDDVKKVLLERRPDLAQIKLNAENTLTVLPYIDLVNELLEEAIAPPCDYPDYPANQDAPTVLQRQTTLTTEELNANPQHVNKYAYEILANPEAYYPWSLPFDLPLHEARTYLGQLGIDRTQLMRTFQKPHEIPSQQAIDIAIEGLGLSKAEADIIVGNGTASKNPWAYWELEESSNIAQNPADPKTWVTGSWFDILSNVRIFLLRSGLTFQILKQLLDAYFINPNMSIQITNDIPDSCNLDTMRINGLDDPEDPYVLDRLHRFVRLMRRLDWDVYTLDSTLSLLRAGTLSDPETGTLFLRQLYAIQTAMRRFNIPVNAATGLFGSIETRNINDFPNPGNQRHSLFYKLFQNCAVLNPVDSIFDLNEEGTEVKAAIVNDPPPNPLPDPPMLADHKPTLLGAFEISDADLTVAIDSFTDGKLNLANLSALYRHIVLASGLGVSIKELITLKALFETDRAAAPYDPFDASRPELLAIFCDTVDKLRATNFSIAELNYLLRHDYLSTSGVAPDDVAVGTILKSILDGLTKVAEENAFNPDPTGTETRRRLATLLKPEDVNSIMDILSGALENDPDNPPNVLAEQKLIKDILDPYMPGVGVETRLAGGGALFAGQERYEYVLKLVLSYFRRSLGTGLIVQQLADALSLPVTTTAVFVKWFPSEKDPAKTMLDDFLILLNVVRYPDNINNPIALNPCELGKNTTNNQDVPFTPYFTHFMALDKASKVIGGFNFNSDETDWLRNNGIQQGWLDLIRLPLTKQDAAGGTFIQWSRLADAALVKKKLPSDGTPFTSLMDIAKNSTKTNQDYFKALQDRTQWPPEILRYLCGEPADTANRFDPANMAPQGLLSLRYPGDYCSERALARLLPAFAMLRRLGISADISGWIGPTLATDQANAIKQCVKAKYSSDQWLPIAKQLRDPLRERQRDALVAYLLVHPPAGVARWKDVSDIYSHYLIDVEMSACQGTSRIVQANSAIQLFVLRCILNIEPLVTIDANIDTEWVQWQWMNRYRLWEANRKIFLFPENWIEPSLRKDKSPFMEDLENDLLQNEVTTDTAENALLGYLEKLEAVARLQVVGMYDDSNVSPLPKIIGVVVNPQKTTVFSGDSQQFTANIINSTNKAVNWTASGGTIDANGLFTADRMGNFSVTATSQEDPTKSSTATVNVPNVSVSIDPNQATLIVGESQPFTATVSGASKLGVSWYTNPSPTQIDSNGLFTAERVGEFAVLAESEANGACSVVRVTVFGCKPPHHLWARVDQSQIYTINVFWSDENADTKMYELERNLCLPGGNPSGFAFLLALPPYDLNNIARGTNHIDSCVLLPGIKIQYRVRAYNHLGWSDWGISKWIYL